MRACESHSLMSLHVCNYKCTHLDTFIQLDAAVAAASAAFPAWRDTPVQQRQRVMFKLQHLIRERTDDLAESITREQVREMEGRKGGRNGRVGRKETESA